ncbi:PAC2 family protein [Paraoerskovia marina]|uniref:PAC2 family protein n=1 Tax=Paraoerskovia marina TaxID=545619 RepID=UPI00049239B1|nr:PAC2 family protein [Paraoerskovia marina]
MLDPRDIYTVDEEAVDRLFDGAAGSPGPGAGPVLVYALRGYVDAGSTGTLVLDHLLDEFESTTIATFDADQLIDYRSKRTSITFDTDHWSDYVEPVIRLEHLRDAEGTGFLVMRGPEPDLQWERFVAATTQLVDRLATPPAVTVHGIPMGIPHTRPLTTTTHATRRELLGEARSWFGRVDVPASAAALLELRLGEAGHDAVGFAVHVPHYLSQSPYPPAAVAAIDHVERVTGLDLRVSSLDSAVLETADEVERQVAESDEVAAVVRALEEQYDAFSRSVGESSLLAQDAPLPTADEIGDEFERFLAQQRDD